MVWVLYSCRVLVCMEFHDPFLAEGVDAESQIVDRPGKGEWIEGVSGCLGKKGNDLFHKSMFFSTFGRYSRRSVICAVLEVQKSY